MQDRWFEEICFDRKLEIQDGKAAPKSAPKARVVAPSESPHASWATREEILIVDLMGLGDEEVNEEEEQGEEIGVVDAMPQGFNVEEEKEDKEEESNQDVEATEAELQEEMDNIRTQLESAQKKVDMVKKEKREALEQRSLSSMFSEYPSIPPPPKAMNQKLDAGPPPAKAIEQEKKLDASPPPQVVMCMKLQVYIRV